MNISNDDSKLDKMALQLEFRLLEGVNEAICIIGMDENGTPSGLSKSEIVDVQNSLFFKYYFEILFIYFYNHYSLLIYVNKLHKKYQLMQQYLE